METQLGTMAMRGLLGAVLATVMLLAWAPASATAQEGPGGLVNPQRDCQTVVTCRFARGGSYRGCISAYTCRVCQFVAARCEVGGVAQRQRCHQIRCTWGA